MSETCRHPATVLSSPRDLGDAVNYFVVCTTCGQHIKEVSWTKDGWEAAVMKSVERQGSVMLSFDARVWARAFIEVVRDNPALATDERTMIGWFARALMRGYDEAVRHPPRKVEV